MWTTTLFATVLVLNAGVGPGLASAQHVSLSLAPSGTIESGVLVLRGGPREATPQDGILSAYPPISGAVQVETRRYLPVTGQAGWFIDTQLNRIGKCYRQNTTQTGRSWIRCTWHSMN